MADRLLIKQSEACARLGISRLTLIREINAGRLRYVLVGKRRKFKPEDLTSYIERQGRGLDGGHPAPIGRGVPARGPIAPTGAPGGVVEFDEILERAGRAPRGTGRRRAGRPRDHRPAGRRKKSAPPNTPQHENPAGG